MVGSLRTLPGKCQLPCPPPSVPDQPPPPRPARLLQLGGKPVYIRLESRARSVCISAWGSAMAFIEHGGHISRHADLIGASAFHRRPGREGLPASGRPWSSRRSSQSRSQLGYPAELALQRPATPVAPSTPLTTRRLRPPTAPRSCPPPYPSIAGTVARHCVAGRSHLHRPPAQPDPHTDHARTSGL